MESIGILGLSVKDHDAAALAPFTIARAERAHRSRELASALGVCELVYLATCNRVEVLYRAPTARGGRDLRGLLFRALLGREAESGEAESTFRRWDGERAVEHLFEVAAGLDSVQLGEREIQGQVRDALKVARDSGTSGVVLDSLVEEALRVARQVHRRTGFGNSRSSLAEIAAELLLERVRRTASPVALIGVSEMTRGCATALLREGVPVLVVNRTLARAEAMVAELGQGDAIALDEFRLRPPQVEAVLCATGASAAVLDRAALERLAARTASLEPPLIVDLAVPPDVDPEAASAAQVPRMGIDEINNLARRQRPTRTAAATAARELVDEALGELRRRLAERALASVIQRINQRYRQTALEGVQRLVGKQGFELDDAAREALERWAETLARRFAHLPTLGLRGLVTEQGMLAVRSFLEACDPSLFEEFCAAAGEIETLFDSVPAESLPEADQPLPWRRSRIRSSTRRGSTGA